MEDDMAQKKVLLITGAGRGMGADIAKAALEAGYAVVATGRDPRKVENAVGAADDLLTVKLDVTDPASAQAAVEAAVGRFGRVDVLVNNAGKSPLYPSLTEVDERLWDSVLAVNLKGPFRLTALAGARMAAGDGGSIINISSTASVHPRPDVIPYAAAKAGLNAITTGFALAYGPKVRVNCIMAGPFLTDISKAWDMEAFSRRARSHALQRGGNPDEIVGAALYFASDASSFTTGAVLTVDGGIP
jgi:NAD(P)-dependent dehydrogenase (short-subunit alcohol dehydrogenase family)